MDGNETCRPGALNIEAAILRDGYFHLHPPRRCPFNLCFRWVEPTLHVKVKDFTCAGEPQSDYVASILNRSGRPYRQALAVRMGAGTSGSHGARR